MKWLLSNRIGKFWQGLSFLWALFVLVLLLVTLQPASGQEAGFSGSSLVGFNQNQYLEGMPELPPLPEIAPLVVPPGTSPLQESILRLKKWDEIWQAEMDWRARVKISWQVTQNFINDLKKADAKALEDKDKEIEAWKVADSLKAKQLNNSTGEKIGIGIVSYLLGLATREGISLLGK